VYPPNARSTLTSPARAVPWMTVNRPTAVIGRTPRSVELSESGFLLLQETGDGLPPRRVRPGFKQSAVVPDVQLVDLART
jgi:hypothetical protein